MHAVLTYHVSLRIPRATGYLETFQAGLLFLGEHIIIACHVHNQQSVTLATSSYNLALATERVTPQPSLY